MEGRPIARETTLLDYIKNPASGNEKEAEDLANSVTLYNEPEYNGHHWGMAVDLNSCTRLWKLCHCLSGRKQCAGHR